VDYAAERLKLVGWLRKQLIGPAMGGNLQGISPLDRYPSGALYPIINNEEGLDPAGNIDYEVEESASTVDGDGADGVLPTVRRRRYMPPSSVGFSFFVRGGDWELQVYCSAALYEREEERDERGRFIKKDYRRILLGGDDGAITATSPNRIDVLQDTKGVSRAGIDIQARPYAGGEIVTVSLFNRQEVDESGQQRPGQDERSEKSLFEVELRCYVERGELGAYPRVEYSLLNEEEQELELQYRNRRIFAVGHGAAVDWRQDDKGTWEIFSDFMPAIEVPQVTADVADGDVQVLEIGFLSSLMENSAPVLQALSNFVEGYSGWVDDQKADVGLFVNGEQRAGERITTRMDVVLERMRSGIALLRRDNLAAQSFAFANQAMLEQMQRTDEIKPGVSQSKVYRWRPFQLAFLLTTIESAIDEDNDFRDTVDLIWFPTGGGKTEAYLGLIAYLVVWRRLKFPESGGGTTTLMRYTLRLLTAQQYLRAARMICALELIRRQSPVLGKEPITVGLWVGKPTSPNTYEQAVKNVAKAELGNANALRSFVLDRCPWCAEVFQAPQNYRATESSFHICCTNSECAFGKASPGTIPCNVVDEALYDSPPTLLIATIDKFARLAWDERATAFFGKGNCRPPELVIQDELHLIAGALGSVAGLYEAALQTVLVKRGVHPKYIASTATIRMAEDQVKKLYGNDIAVFPPPGLDCDDSYFARTVPVSVRPGRLYVGYFAPTLDRQHCMSPLAAALLIAPERVFEPGTEEREALLEAWWTQIVYHGSLKGVGNSHNAFNIDVRDLCGRLAEEALQIQESEESEGSAPPVTRLTHRLSQLTSIASAEENAQVFARLEHDRSSEDCLDAVLATNMVSVGLDVGRLALMVINGQPLTTAEYIQASSRVGRSDVPGIVCVNYYRDQARSLSHYENFRPYHESFYRFVEPTSVTPYTYQARMRALHAALVIVIRHSCSHLLANDKAGKFDPNDLSVLKVIDMLKKRCARSDPERATEIATHLDNLIEEWRDRVKYADTARCQLDYYCSDTDRANERLLFNHDDKIRGLWPTLQSMRNVENSALLKTL
jgi:hypothetical protein